MQAASSQLLLTTGVSTRTFGSSSSDGSADERRRRVPHSPNMQPAGSTASKDSSSPVRSRPTREDCSDTSCPGSGSVGLTRSSSTTSWP